MKQIETEDIKIVLFKLFFGFLLYFGLSGIILVLSSKVEFSPRGFLLSPINALFSYETWWPCVVLVMCEIFALFCTKIVRR